MMMPATAKTVSGSGGTFESKLQNWGPQARGRRTVSLADADAYCAALAGTHYENFPMISWLLPRSLRQHFYNVYAFCRWADDLADEVADGETSLGLLEWWRSELHDCHAGRVWHPVFVALSHTIKKCSIPLEPFEDLISAFEQDQRIHSYNTFDQLRDYCRRSADPVGRLVLYICGRYSEQNARWSDSICTGLQLANFWQDVARDYDIGRVYLPAEDRDRFGYTQNELAARETNAAFLKLMQFEVDRARKFLLEGLPLIAMMPGRLAVDIDLFTRGGLKVLDRIEGIGYRVWEQRPKVTKRDVIGMVFCGLCRHLMWSVGISRTPVIE